MITLPRILASLTAALWDRLTQPIQAAAHKILTDLDDALIPFGDEDD